MIRLPSVQTQQQGREHLKLNHLRRILLHFRRHFFTSLIDRSGTSELSFSDRWSLAHRNDYFNDMPFGHSPRSSD